MLEMGQQTLWSEERPPWSEEQPSQTNQQPPTSEEQPPGVDEQPPTSEEQPPWSEEQPPRADEQPPRSEGQPPLSDEGLRLGNHAPPLGDHASPLGDHVPPLGDHAPPLGDHAPLSCDHLPPSVGVDDQQVVGGEDAPPEDQVRVAETTPKAKCRILMVGMPAQRVTPTKGSGSPERQTIATRGRKRKTDAAPAAPPPKQTKQKPSARAKKGAKDKPQDNVPAKKASGNAATTEDLALEVDLEVGDNFLILADPPTPEVTTPEVLACSMLRPYQASG